MEIDENRKHWSVDTDTARFSENEETAVGRGNIELRAKTSDREVRVHGIGCNALLPLLRLIVPFRANTRRTRWPLETINVSR